MDTMDREEWLTEAMHLIIGEIIAPVMPQDWKPANPFRVSVGYPPRSRANSKVVAVCIASRASADGHNEIFVTPAQDDSLQILGDLAHEAIHYADDNESGHKGHFARVARRIGLEGKLTATTPNDMLNRKLKAIIDILGDIPHAKIDLDAAKPKQSTRMIKVFCPETDDCKFSYRTSQANIDKITDFLCPACNAHDMATD